MAVIKVTVHLTTSGVSLNHLLKSRYSMIQKHREFSRAVIKAFTDVIDTSAPRDTGFMVSRMTTVRQLSGGGAISGYGAGAYSLIGDPSNTATRGTIAAFVKANKKMRGSIPIVPSGAWWTLTPAGKDKLRNSRRHGAYGGSKPAYWYAIAAGLVPNAVGGTLASNTFVDLAINFADLERQHLAKVYFGL